MSKKSFEKATRLNKVIALPSRAIRDSKGNIIKQFYDIYKMH